MAKVKSLFDENGLAFNEDGKKMHDEIKEVLDPILKKWVDNGYHPGELRGFITGVGIISITGFALKRTFQEWSSLVADTMASLGGM